MKLIRVIAVSVIAASLAVGASVHAQSLKNADQPAEFPPSSFKGKQYVDSVGCVFVRAGIDGNVTWVPRVSRSRSQLCGYKPSLPGIAGSTVTAPKLDNNVVQIVPDAPLKSKPAAPAAKKIVKPKIAKKPVAKPAPKRVVKAKPVPVTRQPAIMVPAQNTVQQPVKKVRRPATVQPRAAGVNSPCRGGSSISQNYINHGKYKVRCGPQTELPYTRGTGNPTSAAPVIRIDRRSDLRQGYLIGQIVREGDVGPNVRVLPRHVYESRQSHLPVPVVPAGYRPVWKDDRLNPQRATMTFAGKAKTDSQWSTRVPRRALKGVYQGG